MYRFLFMVCLILLMLGMGTGATLKVPSEYGTIQAGINAAVNGDTVLVADSTYFENINFRGKAITVASYYLVDSDTTHIDSTIINGSQPSHADSGSVVRFVSGEDTTSILYGFTITGGTGTITDSENRVGGGIVCNNSGARISHNKIVNNVITAQKCDGGGIGSWPIENVRHLVIENNLIESNTLNAVNGANGGGIYLMQGRIIHNKIKGNLSHAQSGFATGGGVSADCEEIADRTLVKILDNEITNNQAISDQYMYSGYGGGIDIMWCNIELVGNIISHNMVSGPELVLGGGARLWGPVEGLVKDNIIFFNSYINGECYGGGMDVAHCGSIIVQGNRFEGNTGSDGGGLASGHNSSCVISDNEFIENTADWGGGLCEWDNIQHTVMNNLFVQNTSLYSGGGYYSGEADLKFANNILLQNQSHHGGGAAFEYLHIYLVLPNAQIINNTFVENIADSAGGIYIWDYKISALNTICWGNSAPHGPEIELWGGILNAAFSNIQFGLDSIAIDSVATINWLEGNITKDPLFVDAASGDVNLTENSPCIGRGTPSMEIGGTVYTCPAADYNGNPRPNVADALVDMGALESVFPINGIGAKKEMLPAAFTLEQNYPNPFNPITVIRYRVGVNNYSPVQVDLSIYNLLGQKIATLVSKRQRAGVYQVTWDASGFTSGIYFYKLSAGAFEQTRKLVLIM